MQGGARRDRDLRNAPVATEPSTADDSALGGLGGPEQASLIKKIQLNFDELHVAAIANRIYVYEATQLKPIDILSDHEQTIRGLDVGQMLRNIVSFSRNAASDNSTFMVHCLKDADHVYDQEEAPNNNATKVLKPRTLQDEAIYTGRLKWTMTYKASMSSYRVPKCMAVSQLGDFCVVGGAQFLQLWTIDALMDSYTDQVLYAAKPSADKDETIEEMTCLTGELSQVEICDSGRMFVSLEDGECSLKIWHNEDLSLQKVEEAEVNFRRFFLEGAPIEPYELPKHRSPIKRFTMLSSHCSLSKAQPSVILTITAKKAAIWVESLEVEGMNFSCVQSFDIYYDANFIQMQKLTPRADKNCNKIDLKYDCSKLFHSFNDIEKHAKKQINHENQFGIVPSTLGDKNRGLTSLDWLLLLHADHIALIQCKGLRNSPHQGTDFRPIRKITLPSGLIKQGLHITKLLSCAMVRPGTYDDKFSFMAISESGLNLLKCSVQLPSLKNQLGQGTKEAKVNLDTVLQIPNPQAKVSQMVVHPSLPLVALVYNELNLIQVCKLIEQTHPSTSEPSFGLHGTFRTKPSSKPIIDVQWVGDMDQMIVLTESDSSSKSKQVQAQLVSSVPAMKVISLLGNRSSLQEEVNRALGQSTTTVELTEYRSIASFSQMLGQTDTVKNILFLDTTIKSGSEEQESISTQQISFAAMGEFGQSVTVKTEFQIDSELNICNEKQSTTIKSKAFLDSFTLTKVVATKRLDSFGNLKVYALCLSQKKPQVQLKSANHRGPEKKSLAQLHLLSFDLEKQFSPVSLFLAAGKAEELLERPIVAKFSSQVLGILLKQGNYQKEAPYLYLYNLESGVYMGFLDLNKMLGIASFGQPVDFVFLEDKTKGAIAVNCNDRMYILYQKELSWELLVKSEPIANFLPQSVEMATILPSQADTAPTFVILRDQRDLIAYSESQIFSSSANEQDYLAIPKIDKLHRMIIERQRSESLFNPGLLIELYYKGYGSFVVKILLKLKQLLEAKTEGKLSDYLDMDIETLLQELKSQVETLSLSSSQAGGQQNLGAKGKAQEKKQTAFSVFDDLDESDSEEEKQEEVKQDEKDAEDPKKLFKECAESLATLLAEKHSIQAMGLDVTQADHLVTFVLKFKNIFEIDFYVDPLASNLLRKVFFETEKVDEIILQNIKEKLAKNQAPDAAAAQENGVAGQVNQDEYQEYVVEEVKPFSMEEYMANLNDKPQVQSVGDLDLVTDWSSAMVCQALHSENQEVIMKYLAERFSFEKNMTWAVMRKLCIPVWLKDVSQLKKYIEFVAKTEYRVNEGRPAMCKADYAAIWYTLLGKKSVLQNLYSLEVGHEKFAEFFKKDFSQAKTKTIAEKNGMALVAKQKYHLACSFLLLAEKLEKAVQVALDRLKDPVLAILLCRVSDPEGKTGCLDSLLQKWFIDRGIQFNDPFLMNIGYWLKKEFVNSVNQLSPDKEESGITYIYKNDQTEFNLTKQSLLLDQQHPDQNIQKVNSDQTKVYPIVSKRTYLILDLVKRLRQAPDVKRALNKAWANQKAPGKNSGGAGSIFDDFMGGGSDSSSEEKEEEKKEEIQVDESKVLRQAIKQTLDVRQTVVALLLIEENKELAQKLDKSQVERISQALLLDLVVNFVIDQNSSEFIKLIRKGLSLLASQLNLESTTIQNEQFLLKQLQMMGLLKCRVEFLIDQATQDGLTALQKQAKTQEIEEIGLQIIEQQTSKLQSLVTSVSVCGGSSLNCNDYDLKANKAVETLCDAIESLLDSMLILSCATDKQPSQTASRNVLKSPVKKSGPQMNKEQISNLSAGKFNGLNQIQLQNGGDDVVGAEDSDEEEAKQEIHELMTSPTRIMANSGIPQSKEDGDLDEVQNPDFEHCTKEDLMNTYLIKFRATLTLVLALHTLSIQLAKYSLAKDLQEVLNVVLGIAAFADQMDSLTISEEQIMSLKSALELNQLKEHLLKIKGTVKRNIAFSEQSGGDLNGPRRRKESRNIHQQLQQVYDFLDLWFKQMLVSRTSAMLSQKQLNQIQLLSTTILTKNQDKDCKYLQQLMTSGGNFNILHQFKNSYEKEDICLKDMTTYIFTRILSPVHQRAISCELDQIVEERFRSMGKSISMTYFFSNVEKLRYFGSTFEMKEKSEALKDLQLGISHQKNSSGTVDLQIQNSLFCTGIELFKQRQEPIVDICFDRSGQHDMMAMAIQAKGMREISVIDTLVYRNRRDGGLEMIDEDQMSWAECLHRYEPIQQVHSDLKPTTDSIKAALYGLYYHVTVNQTTKQERPESSILVDEESRTQKEWDGQPAANYYKTYSDLRITHDDYTNAIEAHPLLPIYLSGNAKGLVCMWSFNQMADKSLNQWMLDKDTPPNQANPKKATVKKIEFNSYGDKFAALNTGGQLFVMNFDLETSSKVEPLWSTLMSPKLNEIRLSDYSFLDRDSLIAGVSIREKVLNVYDTLLPPKHSMVQSHRTGPGGNLMQLCSDNRRILCFNGKPGYVTEYDLRKEGEVITNKLLAKEEISAVALSPDQQTLLLGQVDGIVKIFDIQVSDNSAQGTVLTEKEPSISAFTSYGRQSAVSKLRFHPVSGALFAASSVGCVKLLRTAI